jgi:hypothetical protein
MANLCYIKAHSIIVVSMFCTMDFIAHFSKYSHVTFHLQLPPSLNFIDGRKSECCHFNFCIQNIYHLLTLSSVFFRDFTALFLSYIPDLHIYMWYIYIWPNIYIVVFEVGILKNINNNCMSDLYIQYKYKLLRLYLTYL